MDNIKYIHKLEISHSFGVNSQSDFGSFFTGFLWTWNVSFVLAQRIVNIFISAFSVKWTHLSVTFPSEQTSTDDIFGEATEPKGQSRLENQMTRKVTCACVHCLLLPWMMSQIKICFIIRKVLVWQRLDCWMKSVRRANGRSRVNSWIRWVIDGSN